MIIPAISLVDFIFGMSQKTEKKEIEDRSEIRINREFFEETANENYLLVV